jgi:bacteriochlorophyll 4-vinyl reductase
MTNIHTRPTELAVPVASLKALRGGLEAEVGPDAAAHALRLAGNAAGEAMFRPFVHGAGVSAEAADPQAALATLPEGRFWEMLAAYFASRGWGRLTFSALHPGVGALDTADWVEADPDAVADRPCCYFTTGLFAGLLGRVTGQEVAVLEVSCRSQGEPRCRFLFGPAEALGAVYGDIAAGTRLEDALASLG